MSSEKDIRRLSTFPEQNPNPVLEFDYTKEKFTYKNPAAKKHFEDLDLLEKNHR